MVPVTTNQSFLSLTTNQPTSSYLYTLTIINHQPTIITTSIPWWNHAGPPLCDETGDFMNCGGSFKKTAAIMGLYQEMPNNTRKYQELQGDSIVLYCFWATIDDSLNGNRVIGPQLCGSSVQRKNVIMIIIAQVMLAWFPLINGDSQFHAGSK